MKLMKYSALALGVLMASSTYAEEKTESATVAMPDLHVNARVGVLQVEDKDLDPEAYEVELGLKGGLNIDGFKMRYMFSADVSKSINRGDSVGDDDNIFVKEAYAIFPTSVGAFVLGPRITSGVYRDLYSNINLFEYNKTANGRGVQTGNPIFAQADTGDDVVAYVTPRWNNTYVVGAILALDEDNGEDYDVKTVRVVHKTDKMRLGASWVGVDVNSGPPTATKDYNRYALTAGYQFDQLHLGATYEMNKDTFNGNDFDSLGVAARYNFTEDLSAALAYYDKDADNNTADNSGVVVQVKKQLNKNVSLWAETGQYDNSPDNIALGVNLSF